MTPRSAAWCVQIIMSLPHTNTWTLATATLKSGHTSQAGVENLITTRAFIRTEKIKLSSVWSFEEGNEW